MNFSSYNKNLCNVDMSNVFYKIKRKIGNDDFFTEKKKMMGKYDNIKNSYQLSWSLAILLWLTLISTVQFISSYLVLDPTYTHLLASFLAGKKSFHRMSLTKPGVLNALGLGGKTVQTLAPIQHKIILNNEKFLCWLKILWDSPSAQMKKFLHEARERSEASERKRAERSGEIFSFERKVSFRSTHHVCSQPIATMKRSLKCWGNK